jgi:hypothetical protein
MSKARALGFRVGWHALYLAFALAGCGGEDSTGPDGDGAATIPASWAGIWSVQTTSLDCDTGDTLDVDTAADTLCAGEPFAFEFQVGDSVRTIPCTGTIGETAFDIDCASTLVFFCPFDVRITLSGTKAGDTFTGTGRLTGTPSSECPPGAPPQCFDIEIEATRTSSSTPGCAGGTSRALLVGRVPFVGRVPLGGHVRGETRTATLGRAFRFSERKRTVVSGRVP